MVIHITEVKRTLDKAEKRKAEDYYDMVVATIGSSPVVAYHARIIGCYRNEERYRVALENGQIRTVNLPLILEFEGKEVIW